MKNKIKTRALHYRGGLLTSVFLLGIVGAFPQGSTAKQNDGVVNARNDEVVVSRDPFWPVGYQVKSANNSTKTTVNKTEKGEVDWNEAMKQVIINGVSSRAGDEYIAVINNEVKNLGESVSIWYGGSRYTWTVDSIAPPGAVKLRRVSSE